MYTYLYWICIISPLRISLCIYTVFRKRNPLEVRRQKDIRRFIRRQLYVYTHIKTHIQFRSLYKECRTVYSVYIMTGDYPNIIKNDTTLYL